jgi:hypothetical protein
MRNAFLTAAAVCALGVAAGCSSSGPAAPSAAGPGASAPVMRGGGYAFPTKDAPYEAILAEASRTGRPALLFFWTSW